MNERRVSLINEEPRHKKKSTAKGLPRSKHKHAYETVLLYRYYHHKNFKDGSDVVTEKCTPTKVCTICGRIDYVDTDPSYYTKKQSSLPWVSYNIELSEKALNLPKWYTEDYFDKFAKRKI